MKTEAVVVDVNGVAGLREVELPEVTGNRVRVRTIVSGVSCGTEGDSVTGRARYVTRPFITGYQAVGRVVESGAAGFAVGDLVVTKGGGLWSPIPGLALGGSHARESVAEAETLVKLSADTPSLETASYAVLAAVAYEALTRMRVEKGRILGVFGLGMLGQFAVRIGKTMGLRVVGINRAEWKRELAKEFGPVCAPEAAAIKDAVRSLGEDGIDMAFETVGRQEIFDLAMETLGRDGELALVGYYPDKIVVDFDICHAKNIQIHNPVGFGKWVPEVVRMTESGELNIDALITHRVKAADVTAFYRDMVKDHSKYLGAVIEWGA